MEFRLKNFPEEITFDRVVSAYRGKVGCMCGCNGDYAYTSKYQDFASKDRGYPVSDDEVSDKKVRRRYNDIQELEGQVEYTMGLSTNGIMYIYAEYGNNNCMALYFKAQ